MQAIQKNYRAGGVGMIAALPGTYIAHAYFDDNQVELVRCTVVGWQIAPDRRITPLVVDPRAVEDETWCVIHPDGRVESSDGRSWPDEDTWIDEERRNRRDAA